MSRSIIVASLLLAIGATVAACKPAESEASNPVGSAQDASATTTAGDQGDSTTTQQQ